MGGLKYSTSLGIGCGFYDAMQSGLGLESPGQVGYRAKIGRFACGVITAGCIFVVPAYLEGTLSNNAGIEFLNPTFANRMRWAIAYNTVNAAQSVLAGGYHLLKGNYDQSADDLREACNFGWRGGLDSALWNCAPLVILRSFSYMEGGLHALGGLSAFIPQRLRDRLNFMPNFRDGLNSISDFIDSKIIGRFFKSKKPAEEQPSPTRGVIKPLTEDKRADDTEEIPSGSIGRSPEPRFVSSEPSADFSTRAIAAPFQKKPKICDDERKPLPIMTPRQLQEESRIKLSRLQHEIQEKKTTIKNENEMLVQERKKLEQVSKELELETKRLEQEKKKPDQQKQAKLREMQLSLGQRQQEVAQMRQQLKERIKKAKAELLRRNKELAQLISEEFKTMWKLKLLNDEIDLREKTERIKNERNK